MYSTQTLKTLHTYIHSLSQHRLSKQCLCLCSSVTLSHFLVVEHYTCVSRAQICLKCLKCLKCLHSINLKCKNGTVPWFKMWRMCVKTPLWYFKALGMPKNHTTHLTKLKHTCVYPKYAEVFFVLEHHNNALQYGMDQPKWVQMWLGYDKTMLKVVA